MELSALMQAVRTHQAPDAWRPVFTREQWDVLGRHLVRRAFAGGEALLQPHLSAGRMWCLESGTVQAVLTLPGSQRRVNLQRAGAVLGEASLFADVSLPLQAEAVGPVVAWAVERRSLEDLIAHHGALALELLRSAAEVMAVRSADWLRAS